MGKKYKVIYADPPWQYKVYSKKGEGRSAENHYHTMNIEDIRSLPVGEIADDDCILFLWVTFPCLLEGISVMESWGFTYKTCGFNWVREIKNRTAFLWDLASGLAPTRKSVCLAQRADRKGYQRQLHRYVMQELWSIAKSRMKSGRESWNFVEMCHALSFLQGKGTKAGTVLAMPLTERIYERRYWRCSA